jgi:hypothetical protein
MKAAEMVVVMVVETVMETVMEMAGEATAEAATPHTVKNSSLQPLHLARLLTLGDYVMLTMMLVDVRVPAGLHASDVNGSDPMDVSAAEQKRCACCPHSS